MADGEGSAQRPSTRLRVLIGLVVPFAVPGAAAHFKDFGFRSVRGHPTDGDLAAQGQLAPEKMPKVTVCIFVQVLGERRASKEEHSAQPNPIAIGDEL